MRKEIIIESFEDLPWHLMPVDKQVKILNSNDKEQIRTAIGFLDLLVSYGNKKAKKAIFNFFKDKEAITLESVQIKTRALRKTHHLDGDKEFIQILVDELYKLKPSNTTRQWFKEIIKYLKQCDRSLVNHHFDKMLDSSHFSSKVKQSIRKEIESPSYYDC